MTLPTESKTLVLESYPTACSKEAPKVSHLHSKDMMQIIKGGPLPETIKTVNELVIYLARHAQQEFSRKDQCIIVVLCFDCKTCPVKSIVEYGKRKEHRCKECINTPGVEYSPVCSRNCIEKAPFRFEDGPYLPRDGDAPLPFLAKDWMRYAADSRNLRYELYPRLYNYFLTGPWVPEPGKTLILNGLPCKSRVITIDDFRWQMGYTPTTEAERRILEQWDVDYLPINFRQLEESPDMFFKTIRIQNVNGLVYKHEVPEMQHNIAEADNAVFYYMQHYPNANVLIDINDGDAISIGLLRVIEEFDAGVERRQVTLALPNKKKAKPGEISYSHDYIDLIKMKKLIEENPLYKAANVANPVATLVFLIILAGTDFFKGFCKGIGYKTIWETFHARLPMFSHLVQWNIYDMIPSPTTKRTIVLDEALFHIFVQYCYLHKYAKGDDSTGIDVVKLKCSKFKDRSKDFPTDGTIRQWARQIDWNLQYWLNDCRNVQIDPFEEIDGKPYYPFDKKTMSIMASTAPLARKRVIDEAYKKHMYVRKTKTPKQPKQISEKRQTSAINSIKGKI